MAALELILLLLAVSAGLRLLAERLRVPYPSVLVVAGVALAITPGLPQVDLAPEILFLIFIPPLLYFGALTYPLREVRLEAGPITRLAVILVLVSMTVTAIAVHAWDSAFTWGSAFALGAIVAPPDPVAVLSMMRTLRLPRNIESVLEGEGLFNDVTALVAYRFAVAAVVTGTFVARQVAVAFVFAAVAGVAIGLVVGVIVLRIHRLARDAPVVELAISLLTPFASYLGAERIGASGVLAVVATGLYTARRFPRVVRSEARVQSVAMWNVVTFLLESLVFILVGLEFPSIARVFERSPFAALMREALMVTGVVVAVRLVWVVISAYAGNEFDNLVRRRRTAPQPLRNVLFVGWAGLRGGDSLVIALALPLTTASGAPFPAREQIVFVTFVVICATLIVQGPTLPYVARALRLRRGGSEGAEEVHARLVAVEAGLQALDAPELKDSVHPEVVRYLRRRHVQRARRWASRETHTDSTAAPWLRHEHVTGAPSHSDGVLDERRAAEYRRVRGAMIAAELQAVLDLRDAGTIDDGVMRRIQRDLDFESIMLESDEPVT
ncbi:MAG TPA: Na+/H+ antiporter, partial [Gemmatimonadaceae bacterium]|nr:Na+/H+ antiporter [Gemmatimonadaceae bacterium]